MTGLEVFAKALLGPVVGVGAKQAKAWILGDPGMNELIKVCEQTLDIALESELGSYSDAVEVHERTHLRSVLARAIGLISQPELLFPVTSDPSLRRERLRDLVAEAHASQDLDWATFQILVAGKTIRLDETRILLDFLTELPTRISAHARAHNSALHEFATEGHLVEIERLLLKLQADVVLVLTRSDTPDWNYASQRAIGLQRSQLGRRRLVEDDRTPYIVPSADAAWEQVHGRRDWPAEVLSELRRLRSEAQRYLGDSAAVLVPLIGFDGAVTASATHKALQALPLDPIENKLLEELSRQRKKSAEATRRHSLKELAADEEDFSDARRIGRTLVRVRWLKAQAKRPTFDATLALAGAFGSGRSALLTHIGEWLTAEEEYAVFLDLRDTASIETALVAQAGRLFGGTFAALEDIERFLASGDRVLLVLIDDFDVACDRHPSLAQELAGLIDHATAERRLVFVVAFDEASTDRVLLGKDPYFWTRYGLRPDDLPDHLVTGWWDLGRSNVEEALGLRILAATNPSQAHDVHQMITDPSAFSTETTAIANPLAAWLRTETHDENNPAAAPVTDINQTEFVAAYWRRLKTLRLAGRQPSDSIDACVTELARRFGDPKAKSLNLNDLVAPRPAGGGLFPDDLALLTAAGLLLRHEGDVEIGESACVEPRFAPLWGYRIARPLVADANQDGGWATFQVRLNGWQARARDGESLGEAVCQFTLALLKTLDDTSLAAALWRDWAAGNRTPKAPLLLASVTASSESQRIVIDQLESRSFKPRNKRELFLLLRFVTRCQLEDWAGDKRLLMVQRSYGRIAEYGLPSYLHLVLSRVLTAPNLVSDENYVHTLEALIGVPAPDSAEVAADLAVECGRRVFGDDLQTWLAYLMRLCKRVDPAARSKERGRSTPKREPRNSARQKSTGQADPGADAFVLALIKAVAAELVSTEPFESYRIAVAAGWCAAAERGVATATAQTMRNELNAALGASFHRQGADPEFADGYLRLVTELVHGQLIDTDPGGLQREWAFFLIRNSAVTLGKAEVEVDERFHPLLRTLASDRELTQRLRKWADPLYRANGIRS